MGMRRRILIAIGMTFASLVLVLYLVARVILMESFTELEKQYVNRDVQRTQSALSDELDTLDTLLLDCAARDDTYTFIEDANEEYIESNFTYETFTDSRLDLVLFVNSSGQTVFGTSFRENRKAPVPQSLQEHLTEDALLDHPNTKSSIRGIVLIPEGSLLIASRPILTSEKEGPIRGTMIVGRYLDSVQLERLAQITHLSLALHRLDDAQMPRDFQTARSSLLLSTAPARPQEMPIFVQPLNGESVAGYTLLKDIYDNPSLVLRVDVPRDIYRRGQASMLYLVFLLLFGGMAFTGMTSWVADKALISRLVQLNADVDGIGASGDLSARVSMTGRDELADLAGAINEMLAALERFRRELRESASSLKRRNRELSTLYEAATAISSDLSLSIVLQTVAEQLAHALDSSGCALSLWNREEAQVEALVNYSTRCPDETEPTDATYDLADYPAVQRVLESGQPIVIQQDDLTAGEAELASIMQHQAHTLLMLPLLARDRVVGLVELIDDVKERDYTPKDIRLAESLAVHAAIAIENARLYEQAQQEIVERKRVEERLTTVRILGRELVLSRDEQQVAQATIDAAMFLLQCQSCELWLVDEEEKRLTRRAVKAKQRAADAAPPPPDSEPGIIAAVARNGASIYLPDAREAPRHVGASTGTGSELCVPLKVEDRVIGTLNAKSEKLAAFDDDAQQILSTLADQTALAIENARLYERMRTARDRLQTISRQLVEVQEAERRHIARELHDEIGQILTGLRLVVEMSTTLPADQVETSLGEALTLVNELAVRVRSLSLDLRPTTLDDLGLAPALRWHFERYTAQTNVHVIFKHTGVEGRRFAPEIESTVYRIVQEALTNVARHSGAVEVTARLWADQNTLGIQIEDQGTGFDSELALTDGASSGLSGMYERAALLGGQLTVKAAPGAGARLTAEFPLEAHSVE